MALKGCYVYLKYMIYVQNLFYWISGLSVTALAVWMLVDPTFYISIAQDEPDYYSGVFMLLLFGILTIAFGVIGCVGTCKESSCTLLLYFCCLLISLVAQVAACVWMFRDTDKLEELVRYTVKSTVEDDYGKIYSRTAAFDAIQEGLECCGAEGPQNWAASTWKSDSDKHLKLTIKSNTNYYHIPQSCCNRNVTGVQCPVDVKFDSIVPNMFYSEGCSNKLLEALKTDINKVIIAILAIGLTEFCGAIVSLILFCAIRTVRKYK